MKEQKEEQQFLNSIKEITPKHCDACGAKYKLSDLKVVKKQSQNASIHIKCSECGNSYLINIFTPMLGVLGSTRSKIDLDITDPREIMLFASNEVISLNEALDAFNRLSKGNFFQNLFTNINVKKISTPNTSKS